MIQVVGHRVVHGADQFSAATVVNQSVKDAINEAAALAPLHNPPNLLGISVAEVILGLTSSAASQHNGQHVRI